MTLYLFLYKTFINNNHNNNNKIYIYICKEIKSECKKRIKKIYKIVQ